MIHTAVPVERSPFVPCRWGPGDARTYELTPPFFGEKQITITLPTNAPEGQYRQIPERLGYEIKKGENIHAR